MTRQLVVDQGNGRTDELTCTTKTGEVIPADISASAINIEGRDCIIAIVRDISKRKRTEEALRETTQTLQALIQASPLPIIARDRDAKVKMWNPAAERIFGWSEEEVLGHPYPIVPEEKQEEFRANLERSLRCARRPMHARHSGFKI